jgi:hydroxymethylbilane synthase
MSLLRIATRQSQLALTQTRHVAALLAARSPDLDCQLVGMTTTGDQVLDRPLAAIGGKGLFVKELEIAMQEGRADCAVHSAKDVPIFLPEGFALSFVAPRVDPQDAWVSTRYASPGDLPAGARVGTSSLRRAAQLRARYPGLVIEALRGNVNTRLTKLDRGDYDGIVLAAAGLRRLGFADRIRTLLEPRESLPAIAQGVLAIEYPERRADLAARFAALSDPGLTACVVAERALGRVLEGSCEVPLGGYATLEAGTLTLDGLIATPDGSRIVRDRMQAPLADAEGLGERLGERLLTLGGEAVRALLPRR